MAKFDNSAEMGKKLIFKFIKERMEEKKYQNLSSQILSECREVLLIEISKERQKWLYLRFLKSVEL